MNLDCSKLVPQWALGGQMLVAVLLAIPSLQANDWTEIAAEASRRLCDEGFYVDMEGLQLSDLPDAAEVISINSKSTYYVDVLRAEFPDAYWEAEAVLQRALGGTPTSGVSMLESRAIESSLTTLARYDASRTTLFLSRALLFSSEATTQYVVSHELAHAWQQQSQRLHTPWPSGQSSEEFAIYTMLIEGEADLMSLVANDLLAVKKSDDVISKMLWSSSVQTIRDTGLHYLRAVWERGGWAAVEAGMHVRPMSTEQIMHPPEKAGDMPTEVKLPELSGLGALELAWYDTLGEWGIYSLVLTDPHAPTPLHGSPSPLDPERLATGWDGDRLLVIRTSSGVEALLWRTVWDRECDAEEFGVGCLGHRPGLVSWRTQVVDWVWSSDLGLERRLFDLLCSFPQETLPDSIDADTSKVAEERQ